MFKVFFKKFFGPKYRTLFIAIGICLYLNAFIGNVEYAMAFDVYLLANTILTIILTFQTLTSKDNAQSFKRLFTYPLNPIEFKIKYIISICIYSLITRNLLLYIFYINVSNPPDYALYLFLASFFSTTLLTISQFLLFQTHKKLSIVISILEAFFYIMVTNINILIISYIINILLSLIIITKSNTDLFKYEVKDKSKKIKRKNGNFILYLIRYFLFNKTYIISFVSMIILAVSLVSINEQFKDIKFIPYALCMIIYNTPLTIPISINKTLQSKIKSYPNSIKSVFLPYFFFVFIIDILVSAIFFYTTNTLALNLIILQLCLITINSFLTVFLEYKMPIKNWNTETELWNNQRKYITLITIFTIASIFANFM